MYIVALSLKEQNYCHYLKKNNFWLVFVMEACWITYWLVCFGLKNIKCFLAQDVSNENGFCQSGLPKGNGISAREKDEKSHGEEMV